MWPFGSHCAFTEDKMLKAIGKYAVAESQLVFFNASIVATQERSVVMARS